MNETKIALISAIISAMSLLITIVLNIINQYKLIKDNEPQLSFSLKNYSGFLFLTVHNKGMTKAKNVKINIDKIHNNGEYSIQEDYIFNIPFKLAADKKVQGMVAIYGENISNHVFPYLDIRISYEKPQYMRENQQNIDMSEEILDNAVIKVNCLYD